VQNFWRIVVLKFIFYLLFFTFYFLSFTLKADEWTKIEIDIAEDLLAISGSSDNNIFAVGKNGTVLRYKNYEWQIMDSGTNEHLKAVWVNNANDVYAVGQSDIIIHYDGIKWSASNSTENKSSSLNGIWGFSSTDIFVVGNELFRDNKILHYNGNNWSEKQFGINKDLYAIWGNSRNNLFAVGTNGTIFKYDGFDWKDTENKITKSLFSIWGSDEKNIFAVGGFAFNQQSNSVMLHYDGNNWNDISDGENILYSIWGTDKNNIYAVGANGTIKHYNNNKWSNINSGTGENINGIWGNNNLFAVGNNGLILRSKISTIESGEVLNNLVVDSNIKNNGLINNVEIKENGKITGGNLAGIIFNSGTICDVELEANTSVIGGILDCSITGDVQNIAHIGNTKVLESSSLCNVSLSPTVILEGEVELCENVKQVEDIYNLTLADFDIKDVSKITSTDIKKIETTAFSIFNANDIKNLSAEVFKNIDNKQLASLSGDGILALDKEQFNLLPNINDLTELEKAKLFTNLNYNLFNPDDIKNYLPENWNIDINGDIDVPIGTKLSFREYRIKDDFPSSAVKIVEKLPDFNSRFALGGKVDTNNSILDDLNHTLITQSLGAFKFSQQEDATLFVNSEIMQFSFMPNIDNMQQITTKNNSKNIGVSTNENNFYNITTISGQNFELIPVPKNIKDIWEIQGKKNHVKLGKYGDIIINFPTKDTRANNSSEIQQVVIFDPFIEAAPEGANLGVNLATKKTTKNLFVFSDKKAQKINPTVRFPQTLIKLASEIPSIKNSIKFNADGSFKLKFNSLNIKLTPTFETQIIKLSKNKFIKSSIVANTDGSITYSVHDGENLVMSKILISIIEK
jgi:hypothetical protein